MYFRSGSLDRPLKYKGLNPFQSTDKYEEIDGLLRVQKKPCKSVSDTHSSHSKQTYYKTLIFPGMWFKTSGGSTHNDVIWQLWFCQNEKNYRSNLIPVIHHQFNKIFWKMFQYCPDFDVLLVSPSASLFIGSVRSIWSMKTIFH